MNSVDQHRIGRTLGPGKASKPETPVLNTDLGVQHFRKLAQARPRTKAGQVRQMWPEIKTALVAGHRLKDIRTWLSEIGIEIGYARLSDYVGQMKRREAALPQSTITLEAPRPMTAQDKSNVGRRTTQISACSDPLTNLQEHERRPALFDFNPEPDAKKLI